MHVPPSLPLLRREALFTKSTGSQHDRTEQGLDAAGDSAQTLERQTLCFPLPLHGCLHEWDTPVPPRQVCPSAAFTPNVLYSHVVEPVTHGGARSARVGPWISCSPGVRAAHYGAPHAWLVHPVRWSMELDGRMACAHRLAHTHSPSSPSQSQTQAAREQCV